MARRRQQRPHHSDVDPLWKTQGVTASPWRDDIRLGAVREDGGGVRIYVASKYRWRGMLRFDRKRHKEWFHMPLDYARINQFPEWFAVEDEKRYRVFRRPGGQQIVEGRDLRRLEVDLPANGELCLTIKLE